MYASSYYGEGGEDGEAGGDQSQSDLSDILPRRGVSGRGGEKQPY